MRKQEVIHVHALCYCVRGHVEAHLDPSGDPFRDYDDFDVGPNAIHRRKDPHKTALFHLLDGLVAATESAPVSETLEASDDSESPSLSRSSDPETGSG